jgi:hypothetical protein
MEVTHTKLWTELPHDIYVYFFRKVFAGDRGVKQSLTLKFYQALYDECQRQGIPGEWDPDNYRRINDIMSNLNFRANEPVRSRRTAIAPSKHKAQSASGGDESRPTHGAGQETPNPSNLTSNPVRPS